MILKIAQKVIGLGTRSNSTKWFNGKNCPDSSQISNWYKIVSTLKVWILTERNDRTFFAKNKCNFRTIWSSTMVLLWTRKVLFLHYNFNAKQITTLIFIWIFLFYLLFFHVNLTDDSTIANMLNSLGLFEVGFRVLSLSCSEVFTTLAVYNAS